jgi:ketosteroid isomerase-like protein
MSRAVQTRILRLEREQAAAFNAGDVGGATKMFAPGFVGFSSTKHARIRGISALANTFSYYLKRTPKMRYTIQKAKVDVHGAMAVATFYWKVSPARGRSIRGRGTHVFARKGKAWRVVHEHYSRAH